MRTQSTLTILMITQICLLTFCNLSASIQKIYTTVTASDNKNPERRALESVSFQFVFLFTYVGIGLPFYLYTLVGAVFRQALLRQL
ncbi:hypothetical protein I4U23_023404 [Adineta vaga]|nr:hypothetical protein I4U23_023404 [Adineta vaga]